MKTSLDRDQLVPLTPHELYVLLALAGSQDNAYGLMKVVERESEGAVTVVAGTLYPLLKRLTGSGYIKIGAVNPASGPTGSSNLYRITDMGRTVLAWELGRYHDAVELARDRGVQPAPSPTASPRSALAPNRVQ